MSQIAKKVVMDGQVLSATQALIGAMEALGDSDDNQVLVLLRDKEGRTSYCSNLAYRSDRIGMLQTQMMWEQAAMAASDIQELL